MLFNFFKLKRKENITESDFSKKIITNKGEIFENNLLKKYGKCAQLVTYGLNILFITDTHNCLSYNENQITYLRNLNHLDYDLCLILGDLSARDIDTIKSIIPNDKIYGIVGNHDSIEFLEQNDITNISGKVITCKGVKIAAIMGSNRYKNGDYGMQTHEESVVLAETMDDADILISHDRAYTYDNNDDVHDGLKGITEYIYKNHIPLHIHGHLHEEKEEILKNGTKSICLYQVKLMSI